MKYVNETILDGASAAVDQVSDAIDASWLAYFSAQIIATGTSTGSCKFQFSNDMNNPTNWSDIANTSVNINPAGMTDVDKTDICARWIRAKYTKNNGAAGTLTIKFHAKGF